MSAWLDHIRRRLAAWEDEERTNRSGFAHVAPSVIAALRSTIKGYEKAGSAHAQTATEPKE